LRHVRAHRQRLLRADLAHYLRHRLVLQVGEDHPRVLPREPQRARPADAARAARDERHFAAEQGHGDASGERVASGEERVGEPSPTTPVASLGLFYSLLATRSVVNPCTTSGTGWSSARKAATTPPTSFELSIVRFSCDQRWAPASGCSEPWKCGAT